MRKLRGHKGAAVVEFAIVLPILLLLIFGIIEFGILIYNKQVLTNASREGARAGIVYIDGTSRVPAGNASNSDTIKGIVNDYANDYLITFGSSTPLNTDVEFPEGQATGDPLIVTVSYGYSFILFPVTDYQITARTVMKYE
jgi:Flp pilus assembly protein TadG